MFSISAKPGSSLRNQIPTNQLKTAAYEYKKGF